MVADERTVEGGVKSAHDIDRDPDLNDLADAIFWWSVVVVPGVIGRGRVKMRLQNRHGWPRIRISVEKPEFLGNLVAWEEAADDEERRKPLPKRGMLPRAFAEERAWSYRGARVRVPADAANQGQPAGSTVEMELT